MVYWPLQDRAGGGIIGGILVGDRLLPPGGLARRIRKIFDTVLAAVGSDQGG